MAIKTYTIDQEFENGCWYLWADGEIVTGMTTLPEIFDAIEKMEGDKDDQQAKNL